MSRPPVFVPFYHVHHVCRVNGKAQRCRFLKATGSSQIHYVCLKHTICHTGIEFYAGMYSRGAIERAPDYGLGDNCDGYHFLTMPVDHRSNYGVL